ncbi:hypothetical protein QVD17_06491 [Tagetes erecta]|uniref:Aminotransferase class V domain-containing protein n=1 Tax=Tagetes erecta TaxID=13708 RepID=A0AAD8LFP8_TARER|nr:hypothetical protein QVD17_06491 [Tagetes erecta]
MPDMNDVNAGSEEMDMHDVNAELQGTFGGNIGDLWALGKIKVDVNKWNVSLMSLSGQKIYGPKGVGAFSNTAGGRDGSCVCDCDERAACESLVMGLKDVAISTGSACTSASLEPSYVLRALGVDEDMAHTSIRFGIGRFTTEEEIDKTIELMVNRVEKLREMSPLYEMAMEGTDIKSVQWSQH